MSGTVTVARKKGPRTYQEDFHFFAPIEQHGISGWLLAVMDGHGGKEVAQFSAREIPHLFELRSAEHAEEALKKLVQKLHAGTRHLEAGSTLSLVLILEQEKRAVVAVLGDSPVVIFDTNGKQYVSPEHNVRSNPAELAAAESRGASYSLGYIYSPMSTRGLQLSRALGNASLDSILSRKPDVYTVSEPAWVLVASDGLMDPGHGINQETFIPALKMFAEARATAKELMVWAEKIGLIDNATAIVWNQ